LGINTFFTGTTAATVGINNTVLSDPSKFAASFDGVGHDTDNGVRLAAMVTTPNPNLGNKTIGGVYRGIVSETMLSAATVKATVASDSVYLQTLQGQRDSISGVNVDEETILMMTYQRLYQANSKLVSMIDEMLRTLINL
jgi:flagellar hook-associated protein 1 FlgK